MSVFFALVDSKTGVQHSVFKSYSAALDRLKSVQCSSPTFAKCLVLVRFVPVFRGRKFFDHD